MGYVHSFERQEQNLKHIKDRYLGGDAKYFYTLGTIQGRPFMTIYDHMKTGRTPLKDVFEKQVDDSFQEISHLIDDPSGMLFIHNKSVMTGNENDDEIVEMSWNSEKKKFEEPRWMSLEEFNKPKEKDSWTQRLRNSLNFS